MLMGAIQGYSQGSLFLAFALMYWYGGTYLADDVVNTGTPPLADSKFEGMFIPIFCMFMLGAGIGQASQVCLLPLPLSSQERFKEFHVEVSPPISHPHPPGSWTRQTRTSRPRSPRGC